MQQAVYIMSVEKKQYICEVILPEKSPIRSAIGKPSSKKAIAKRSAAFEACLLLRKGRYLDDHLLPIYHRQLPEMRNAHLALNLNRKRAYARRIKPDTWERDRGTLPTELYITIVELKSPENLARPCQPLAILTRTRLPDFPPFPLHLQVGKASDLLSSSFAWSFKITGPALSALTEFTLRIFKDIFNKQYENEEAQMSYWLAPVLENRPMGVKIESAECFLDWAVIEHVRAHEKISWTGMSHSHLINRFIVDPFDGERRWYSVEVDSKLGPFDPVPKDAAVWNDSKDNKKGVRDILDYSIRLYTKGRARARPQWEVKQPIIVAHRISTRRDWLDELSEKDMSKDTKSYLAPAPLMISAVSIPVRTLESDINGATASHDGSGHGLFVSVDHRQIRVLSNCTRFLQVTGS